MQRQVYHIWTSKVMLPKRLWRLVQQFWTPIDRTFDQSLWTSTKKIYFKRFDPIFIEKSCDHVFETSDQAKQFQKMNDWKFIMDQLQQEWTDRKKYQSKVEELTKENENLKKENEELKSLPPVEVEHVWLDPNGSPYPKFDDPQDENLTKSKEKPVTVWKNKK